jgi:hypothetical protein
MRAVGINGQYMIYFYQIYPNIMTNFPVYTLNLNYGVTAGAQCF